MAVVACDGDIPYAQLLTAIGPHCLRGETVVVFISEKRTHWAQTPVFLAMLRARQANLFAIIFDQATFLPEGAASGRSLTMPRLRRHCWN